MRPANTHAALVDAASQKRRWTTLAALASAVAVTLTVVRHLIAPLFIDFGDAIFYPARAFLDGASPYDHARYLAGYPATAPFPYPPSALLLALPFGMAGLRTATVLYLMLSIVLVPVLAALALVLARARVSAARVLALSALILVSRPGHMVVVQGQPSLLFIVAAYAALTLSSAPDGRREEGPHRFWGAALSLAVALGKPTIGGPLAILSMVRGRMRVVAASLAIAGALSLVLVPPLAARAGGLGVLLRQMVANEESWTVALDNDPATSVYRLDAIALASRFLGRSVTGTWAVVLGLTVLALGAGGVRRLDRARDPAGACALVCLTIVACTYHQTYDALLLMQAIVALAMQGERTAGRAVERRFITVSALARWILLALLCVPLLNHAATHAVAMRFTLGSGAWLIITSAAGAAAFAAFVLYVALAARAAPRLRESAGRA
jgi:hypothetical protein